MFVVCIERWPAILVDKKEPELWIAILILNNSQKWAILRASSKPTHLTSTIHISIEFEVNVG